MKTEHIISKLADHRINASLWTKKGTRLYLNGYGYNTNKCRQSVYIDLDAMKAVCFTDCPSQSMQWRLSQSKQVVDQLQKIVRYIRLLKRAPEPSEPIIQKTDKVYVSPDGTIIETHIPAKIESVNVEPDASLVR
jgi:hypothetical protein